MDQNRILDDEINSWNQQELCRKLSQQDILDSVAEAQNIVNESIQNGMQIIQEKEIKMKCPDFVSSLLHKQLSNCLMNFECDMNSKIDEWKEPQPISHDNRANQTIQEQQNNLDIPKFKFIQQNKQKAKKQLPKIPIQEVIEIPKKKPKPLNVQQLYDFVKLDNTKEEIEDEQESFLREQRKQRAKIALEQKQIQEQREIIFQQQKKLMKNSQESLRKNKQGITFDDKGQVIITKEINQNSLDPLFVNIDGKMDSSNITQKKVKFSKISHQQEKQWCPSYEIPAIQQNGYRNVINMKPQHGVTIEYEGVKKVGPPKQPSHSVLDLSVLPSYSNLRLSKSDYMQITGKKDDQSIFNILDQQDLTNQTQFENSHLLSYISGLNRIQKQNQSQVDQSTIKIANEQILESMIETFDDELIEDSFQLSIQNQQLVDRTNNMSNFISQLNISNSIHDIPNPSYKFGPSIQNKKNLSKEEILKKQKSQLESQRYSDVFDSQIEQTNSIIDDFNLKLINDQFWGDDQNPIIRNQSMILPSIKKQQNQSVDSTTNERMMIPKFVLKQNMREKYLINSMHKLKQQIRNQPPKAGATLGVGNNKSLNPSNYAQIHNQYNQRYILKTYF